MWSYNLRSYDFFEDQEDSDIEPNASHRSEEVAISDDTRFLEDMDLSSRNDNAHYKPNPWTIAKINAASRKLPSIRAQNRGGPNVQPDGRKQTAHARSIPLPKEQRQRVGSQAKKTTRSSRVQHHRSPTVKRDNLAKAPAHTSDRTSSVPAVDCTRARPASLSKNANDVCLPTHMYGDNIQLSESDHLPG